MSILIGQYGRLVELPYVSSHSLDVADRYTFEEALEGRVFAQVKPSRGRVWALSADRFLAQDQGTLMSFINGEWGYGPWLFIPADARVTNMLTPAQASCDPGTIITIGVTEGGPMLTPDGWAGRSFSNSGTNQMYFGGPTMRCPVIPGRDVTGSAYVQGSGAAVRLSWWDAAGGFISSVTSPASGSLTEAKRLSATGIPPSNAASCLVSAVDSVRACRPAVTWTKQMFAWSDGQGCLKAVVHGASKNLQAAHFDPNGFRVANVGFTVTEVGGI